MQETIEKTETKILKADIKIPPFSRCSVDILIPFHAEYDKVTKLINGIIGAVKSNPYQITLIDDASPNKSFTSLFKDFDKNRPPGTNPILKFIRNEQRLGFAKSLQVGYENTHQPWVMFMHSDCVIEDPQWMVEMGRSLLSLQNTKVKMVGAKCQQKISGVHSGICGKKGERSDDIILKDGFLPLYCVLCHRDLFRHIGGFIKDYMTYEDEELACRMNHYGYKQAICGRSFIYHEGGGTYNSLLKKQPELRQLIDKSREKVIADLQLLLR